ncbi:hypothetical protein Mapa_014312 [Marchantia paleacea]|nr:hypothetical protein Mapa_014312 [Marchantia paleacea]
MIADELCLLLERVACCSGLKCWHFVLITAFFTPDCRCGDIAYTRGVLVVDLAHKSKRKYCTCVKLLFIESEGEDGKKEKT